MVLASSAGQASKVRAELTLDHEMKLRQGHTQNAFTQFPQVTAFRGVFVRVASEMLICFGKVGWQ